MSIEIRPGEKVAIVGENGAGKSTLVLLLMRLVEPTEGRVLFLSLIHNSEPTRPEPIA